MKLFGSESFIRIDPFLHGCGPLISMYPIYCIQLLNGKNTTTKIKSATKPTPEEVTVKSKVLVLLQLLALHLQLFHPFRLNASKRPRYVNVLQTKKHSHQQAIDLLLGKIERVHFFPMLLFHHLQLMCEATKVFRVFPIKPMLPGPPPGPIRELPPAPWAQSISGVSTSGFILVVSCYLK